jgi:hypothetical protein
MLTEELGDILDQLTPREARILRLRYGLQDGESRTLKEVGEMFGLSRERIRQLEKEALAQTAPSQLRGRTFAKRVNILLALYVKMSIITSYSPGNYERSVRGQEGLVATRFDRYD